MPTPIALNLDGSLLLQPRLIQRCAATLDVFALQNALRLRAARGARAVLAHHLHLLRQAYPAPLLTFFGSGDFHHLSLTFLQTLNATNPFSLILIDNHPDWFKNWPQHHCGNWVSGGLKIAAIKQVVMIAQDSHDLRPLKYFTAPFHELTHGKIILHPLQRTSVCVPRRSHDLTQDSGHTRHWWGTCLRFRSVRQAGAGQLFHEIARRLAGTDIYISVDKDCLAPCDATADWEQGGLRLKELVTGVRALTHSCRLIGADVCGDHAAQPLRGLIKRIDAGRLFKRQTPCDAAAIKQNEDANLALLDAFTT